MENKTFELMEKMYSMMQEGFKEVNHKLENMEKRVIIIELDHGKKLDALFDGHLQNSQQLERIEVEVSKHEDFILKRIK